MARYVTVATVRWNNNPNDVRKGAERVREIWELLIDRAALDKPDIFLLPESFMGGIVPREAIPGDGFTHEFLVRKARQYNMYIVAGIDRVEPESGRLYNSAVLYDRAGEVAGIYDKLYPTPGEMENKNITPGEQPRVFDTDFGRIGIAICFDLNFREIFKYYTEQNVELCCFVSQMSGGAHLPTLAREGRMFMASAVTDDVAYIVNPIGAVVRDTLSCGHDNYITARINLDYQLFHLVPRDMTEPFRVVLKRTYGDTVRLERRLGEPYSLVSCDRDDTTAADILREFNVDNVERTLEITRALRRERQPNGF